MKALFLFVFIIFLLPACSVNNNILQTARTYLNDYTDTIEINKPNPFIVIPVEIEDYSGNYIFDTGADLVCVNQSILSNKNIDIIVGASNNMNNSASITYLKSFKISNQIFRDFYACEIQFPKAIKCFGDGIIGNNIIKSSNWLITNDKLICSNKSFMIKSNTSSNIFYYSANGLCSDFIINDCQVDTCLIDYGGLFDIELPLELLTNNPKKFEPNHQYHYVKSSYGIHGKSISDTILRMNCNVHFNDFQIDSVNIDFKPGAEKRVGITFLKRFQTVAINNVDNKLLLGNFRDSEIPKHKNKYSFDLINDVFEISSKVITNDTIQISIGDKFTEINSIKSTELKDYCDIYSLNKDLEKFEYLELTTTDNKKIKIRNWH